MKTIGERIKEVREDLGLTGEEFGKKLNVAKGTVSNWENNNRKPDAETLLKIADLGNVTIDYIVGRTDHKNSFIAEHNIDGQDVKVIAGKDRFPDGFTEKDAADYFEIAKGLKVLGLTHEDLTLLLELKEAGITLQDINMLKKLKEVGIKME
ncbi:helix-turn-helix domain-containing protein [Clostridium thermarum]|uniref:helix-turn-helix domain-containing protein n=1 Tax=Clostridium thermarum TaxID=1716543 RepID=UPI00112168A6|nr:helix-turn-helix transcriptional regulator [Clostridium thermarum]